MNNFFRVILFFWFLFGTNVCVAQLNEVHNNWLTFFDSHKVKGSSVVWDSQTNKFHFYNRAAYTMPIVPAGTFDIMQVLVALQFKTAADTNTIILWDSIKRAQAVWNTNTTLAQAFRNNNGAALAQLANKVPLKYWKKRISRAKYGKMLSEKLESEFWSNGQLVITPAGQIDFLKRLNSNKLPFKNKYCQWAKSLMLVEEGKNYKLYAKTGLLELPDKNVGWFIGLIENPNGVFYFVTIIESTLPVPESFSMSRVYITKKILADLGIIVAK